MRDSTSGIRHAKLENLVNMWKCIPQKSWILKSWEMCSHADLEMLKIWNIEILKLLRCWNVEMLGRTAFGFEQENNSSRFQAFKTSTFQHFSIFNISGFNIARTRDFNEDQHLYAIPTSSKEFIHIKCVTKTHTGIKAWYVLSLFSSYTISPFWGGNWQSLSDGGTNVRVIITECGVHYFAYSDGE